MDDKQYFAIYGVLKAVHTGEIEPDIAADVIVSGLSHAEGEAVGEITIDKHGDAHFRASQGYLDLDQGTYDLYTHPAPQVAVPEGWKLVPVEPTARMMSAAKDAECDHSEAEDWLYFNGKDVIERYKAMLAAAPTAPAGEPRQCDVEIPGDDGLDIHALEQLVSDHDGLPSDWRRVVEGAADMLGESAKQHRTRGDTATAAMCDQFGAMLRGEILSAPAPDEREIAARPGYAGVTVWIGNQQCTQVVDRIVLETSRADELLRHFENARYLLRAGKEGEQS